MSTNHHTAIAANASAVNTTYNTPLGALDAKLTHTVTQYVDETGVSTTITTNGTYYAVTGYEVSFTPAYSGQVFLVSFMAGLAYANTAGSTALNLRITDGANATVTDTFIFGRTAASTTSTAAQCVSGMRAFTAGAGDVGVTRKAKLYATHGVNGAIVSVNMGRILVVTH